MRTARTRFAPLFLAPLTLSACATTPAMPGGIVAAAPAPRFDAIAFFDGRLEGEGRLRKLGMTIAVLSEDIRKLD